MIVRTYISWRAVRPASSPSGKVASELLERSLVVSTDSTRCAGRCGQQWLSEGVVESVRLQFQPDAPSRKCMEHAAIARLPRTDGIQCYMSNKPQSTVSISGNTKREAKPVETLARVNSGGLRHALLFLLTHLRLDQDLRCSERLLWYANVCKRSRLWLVLLHPHRADSLMPALLADSFAAGSRPQMFREASLVCMRTFARDQGYGWFCSTRIEQTVRLWKSAQAIFQVTHRGRARFTRWPMLTARPAVCNVACIEARSTYICVRSVRPANNPSGKVASPLPLSSLVVASDMYMVGKNDLAEASAIEPASVKIQSMYAYICTRLGSEDVDT